MLETGFVTHSEYQKHIRGEWRTVHDLWRHIRSYMTDYAAPVGDYYTKAETDAFFEGYSGGKAQVDAGNVVGLTQGSIPFADASGFLTEDNPNLFWDATNKRLGIGTTAPAIDCALHIEFSAQESVNSRVAAKTRPWRQWVCMDGGWGLAIGIHADDGKIHLNYDVPIGTRIQSMIVFDGPAKRVGILEEAPAYPLDVGGNTRIQGTLDLAPSGTGTDKIIDIIPSASLIAGRTWDGVYIDVDALDPATGDYCTVHGFHFTALNFASTDYDAQVVGFITRAGAVDDFSGFQATLTELTEDKTQNAFLAFAGAVVLSATGKYRGLYVDYDELTRDAGAPILEGVRIKLPANYTNFGTSFAGYFEGDGRSVTICDTTYALSVIGQTALASATLADDARGLSSIFTLSANPAKSDGIAFYCEGHIGAITTDGSTYGAGAWLNIDAGATLGADVRALDIGIYEAGATCSGHHAYGLAIHMEFDDTNPPGGIYPFRINCNDTPGHATPDALIFAANKAAIGVTEGTFPFNNYLKIELQGGIVYRIPIITEGLAENICVPSDGELRFYEGANYVGFKAPELGANQIWALPIADGDAGEALITDGDGNLSFSAGGGNGAVEFDDLTDTPANYVGAADKIVKVNDTPDGLEFGADIENLENVDTLVDQGGKLPKVKAAGAGIEFGADIEDLEDVDTIVGQAGKYAKVKDGDAGIEWDVPAGGNGAIDYLDNFEDASIHWSWRTHNLDADRTIVEAANKLTIAVAAGTNYNWWSTMNDAPKIFTGIGRPPCEIITKLITITTNNDTRAGIFVASNPIGVGADYAMLLGRRTLGGVESLQVQRLGTAYTAYAGAPYTTLPIWLKIQITADIRYGNHLRFYYSVNGVDWTELGDPAGGYSDLLTSDGFVVGLFAQNWSELAVSAEFDFFKVVPCLGADG